MRNGFLRALIFSMFLALCSMAWAAAEEPRDETQKAHPFAQRRIKVTTKTETYEDRELSKNIGQVEVDLLATDRLYFYLLPRLEQKLYSFDQEETEASVAMGSGYKWLSTSSLSASGKVGLGVAQKFTEGIQGPTDETSMDDVDLILPLSHEIVKRLSEGIDVKQEVTFTPTLSDFEDNRMKLEASLSSQVNESLGLKLSVIDERRQEDLYQDDEELQFRFSLNLRF